MGQVSAPVQGDGQYQPATTNPFQNPAFSPFYNDAASVYGKVSDLSALGLDPSYGFFLEETNTDDHDNDGINDLDDLDDDNDGINDLIERFDGCYGTDPYDHDNDGIQDEFDWGDDNDGILEGPIDYDQGNDPWNVTSDRHVDPNAIHPWTGGPVGFGYLVDQNPMDHDNDGITDEDIDGSGGGHMTRTMIMTEELTNSYGHVTSIQMVYRTISTTTMMVTEYSISMTSILGTPPRHHRFQRQKAYYGILL